MGKILEVKNLTVHIKTHKGVVQAVRGVDFYLNEQETLAVVGESGSGKSITMKGVMGILPKNGKVVEGSVMFQGNDLTFRDSQVTILSPEKPTGYLCEPGPAYLEKVRGRFPSRALSR